MGHFKVTTAALLAAFAIAASPASKPAIESREPQLRSDAPPHAKAVLAALLKRRDAQRDAAAAKLEKAERDAREATDRKIHPTYKERETAAKDAAAQIEKAKGEIALVSAPKYLPINPLNLTTFPPEPGVCFTVSKAETRQGRIGTDMSLVELIRVAPESVVRPPQAGDYVGVQINPNVIPPPQRPERMVDVPLGFVALRAPVDQAELAGKTLMRIGDVKTRDGQSLPEVVVVDVNSWLEQ